MSNKVLIGGIILGAVGLLVVGRFYGGNTASQNASVYNGALETASQKNLAPDFLLQKLGGGTITISEFNGKKPVVVDFWASWCPNCRRDMPNLNRFYEKYKDQIEVIGVNLQERESVILDFVTSRDIRFPIALDPKRQASNAFGIQYTNTHFLIDKDGNLVRIIPGDIREEDILSLIMGGADNNQSSIPDEKPCKLAYAEGTQDGEQPGVCAYSS
ncbi:MAG: redoxin domain-containing protein [Parcubacteria group bacterium]|nr:redoxin domain-containing protein [Parcubacteria group bacterium]